PWPPAEMLRVLPHAADLVRGLLGADLVGFHVPRYVRAFADALEDLTFAPSRADDGSLDVGMVEHQSRIIACPIGADAATWSALGKDPAMQSDAAALRAAFGAARVFLAVDRLDYAKGCVERLEAFEK